MLWELLSKTKLPLFKFVRYDLKYSKPYKLVVNGLYKSSKKFPPKLLNFHINGGKIIKKYNIKFININLINIFFLKLKKINKKRQKIGTQKRMKILLEYLKIKIVEHNNNIIVSKFLFTFYYTIL